MRKSLFKKTRFVFLWAAALGFSFCLNWACNSNNPSAPNFQVPVKTIVALNPTLTLTPTFTTTPTPTITATNTVTPTPATPYLAGTFNGFQQPWGVAVDGGSNFYVADRAANTVTKFTSSGTMVVGWGSGGKGKGQISFNGPMAVAVDSVTNLYVAGVSVSGPVSKYDSTGTLVSFSTVVLSGADGLAVDGSGNVYVGDTVNNRIVQLTAGGVLGSGFGGSGSVTLPAAVTQMGGIAVDPTNTYVYTGTRSGTGYNVVLGYTISTGSASVTITGFSAPNGVAFDGSGNLYVADDGSLNQIEEFPAGGFGGAPLVFNSGVPGNVPQGIAVDKTNGDIYVTDSSANHSVYKFAP